ncbi:MAG: hypothetical protein ABI887_12870 [Burkholderiales bacterium]
MVSELGIVLRDQQALLSMLLSHVALADGKERRRMGAAMTNPGT